ncbi:MAG: hypothetical protein RR469_04635 [Erysipelotrichaceae bacterium]
MKKHNDGSTLIEVMVATCILVFAGLIFASGFYTVVKLVADANQVQKATDEINSVIAGDKNPKVTKKRLNFDVTLKIKGVNTPLTTNVEKDVYSSITSKDVQMVCVDVNELVPYDYHVELKMYKDMKEMPETRNKMTTAEQFQYGIPFDGNWVFSNYLFKYVYNSNFPQLNEGFVDQIKKINPDETGPFFIRPFTGSNIISGGINSTTVVFASKSNNPEGWSTPLVFNQDDHAWYYKQKGMSLTVFNNFTNTGGQQLTWSQLTQQMHSGSDGWVKLEDIKN